MFRKNRIFRISHVLQKAKILSQLYLKLPTRVSFHYEYASAVMMGLIFLGVKQRNTIKHI